ncbi:MAG: radical SAM protein [Candidatus Kaelpia imicola]|nr:radical SAM protein [Candidatus Kaelpia imicola]
MIDSLTFIFPRLKYRSGDPPLGICSIASYLKRQHPELKINILDSTFHNSFKKIKNEISRIRPQAIGIYIDSVMYKAVRELIRELPKTTILIAGGPQVTVAPESIIDIVDIAVIGEAEDTMNRLIERLPQRDLDSVPSIYFKRDRTIFKSREERKQIELDSLEIPALDLLENLDQYFDLWHYLDPLDPAKRGLNVIASRGCLFNCSYCQPTLRLIFGDGIRYKSPQYLIKELNYYRESFRIENFFFHDDTLPVNRDWINRFCDIIQNNKMNILWGCNSRIDTVDEELLNKMYQSGLRVIHYGIESGSQRILDQVYNKGIELKRVGKTIESTRKSRIYPSGFFMIGAPDESKKEILKTINLSLKLNLAEASFSITTPFIGTLLYQKMKKLSIFKILGSSSNFDYYSKVSFQNGNNNALVVSLLQKTGVTLFYLHPRHWAYLMRHFRSLRGIKKLLNKIARFF